MITLVDVHIVAPIVIAVSLVGVYALENRVGDVVLAGRFSECIGYVMMRFGYPRITLVIALVLGELAERSYHQSLGMGRRRLDDLLHAADLADPVRADYRAACSGRPCSMLRRHGASRGARRMTGIT